MKKLICVVSLITFILCLVGCKDKTFEGSGFTLHVDTDKFISNEETTLRKYTGVSDINLTLDDELKMVFITVPVTTDKTPKEIKKEIINDKNEITKLLDFYHVALEDIHACNSLSDYKIRITLYNSSSNNNILSFQGTKKATPEELINILKLENIE